MGDQPIGDLMDRIDARMRVVAVIVLLIGAGVALHGYLPDGQAAVERFVAMAMLAVTAMIIVTAVVIQSRRRSVAPPGSALVVCGLSAVLAAEAIALLLTNDEAVLRVSGVAVAIAVVAARWLLSHRATPEPVDSPTDDAGAALSRWVERTKSQIFWSDSTRADWDRRLRPMLARQFELATRQPRSRNPSEFEATGRVLFGDELWAWVDPENISRTGAREKGPGRATLSDIIERLERL